MNLVRIIYVSRFLEKEFDASELANINKTAIKNNKNYEITGELVFGNDYFLQCLEGERDVVSKVFSKIMKDTRHEAVTILSFEEIIEREFPEWSMKLVLLTQEKENTIRRFSGSGVFNPYSMSSKSALELMKALRD